MYVRIRKYVCKYVCHNIMLILPLVNGFQICHHHGNTVDPDHRDVDPTTQSIPTVSQFIGKYFKGINTTPSIVESCLYTVSIVMVE